MPVSSGWIVWSKPQADTGFSFQKPVELMAYCVEKFTQPTETILDPFLGSGTTAVAAKQLGRKYIGIELSQKYVDIANERLKQDVLF